MNTLESDRVRRNTAVIANERIDDEIDETIFEYAGQSPGAITARLLELDREWDIERVLETNASALAFTGVTLGALLDRRWLLLSGGVLAFLFLHGTQGWCPPLPVLRRIGVRTRGEIERERFALKFLRGDFDGVRRPDGRLDLGRLVPALQL